MDRAAARAAMPRQLTPVGREEALRLLGSVSLGRIVFTHQALPAIRPVNHMLDGEDIVVRVQEGALLTAVAGATTASGAVVAYEADVIDPETHLGWSVVATGYARAITDGDELARVGVLLRPWVSDTMTCAVRVSPDLVTGFRLTARPVTLP
jgi:Pyridoxamine 5'-phosphate oxidase